MAKNNYKIPASLSDGYGSMNITLSTKDGSVARMMPLKILGVWAGSIVVFFYLVSNTFIGAGTMLQKIAFGFLWFLWTFLLAKTDKTGRMHVQLIPTLINYLPRKARHISTRKNSNATSFFGIAGITSIDNGGLITYNDGTFGYMYRVVGSASILLFDEDKVAMLNRVDNFYRKIGTEVEVVFVTTKEPQKIYYQMAHLKKQYDNLKVRDKDLLNLMEEQFSILKHDVGSSYKSIHQYMVLKADNKEALVQSKNILQSEVENSSLMIKQCTPLVEVTDIEEVLATIYRKGDF